MIDGPVIGTASGRYVNVLEPYSFTPNIDDIAHHLSHQCRFSGATRVFYSVSEHCCRVADICPPPDRLAALLHDASEYLLQDMARPLKHDPRLGAAYRDAEERLQARIYAHFGIRDEPASVRHADMVLLATERRDLMPGTTPWRILSTVEPLDELIVPWTPDEAREQFLARYEHLTVIRAMRAAA